MGLASFTWQQLLESVVAIAAAYVLALPLAVEREAKARMGIGLRTIPLVSVGTCAYVLISRYLHEQGIYSADGLARTLRAAMTGIGFIGGGAIVKQRHDVHGLATGAAVWTAGAIGAAVAHGHLAIAIVLGLTNVIVLEIPYRLARVRRARARAHARASTARP